MKNIVCFGDSNTWGFIPGQGKRYPETQRWTGLLQEKLGADYRVIEHGMNARTTSFDDPYVDCLNGRKALPYLLLSAKPIDLLVVSLGTNDLKYTDAQGSSKGLQALLHEIVHLNRYLTYHDETPVFTGDVKVLVVSPIALHEDITCQTPPSSLRDKYDESLHFAEWFGPVCELYGATMISANHVAAPSPVDCVHMGPESHAALSDAVYAAVKEILG